MINNYASPTKEKSLDFFPLREEKRGREKRKKRGKEGQKEGRREEILIKGYIFV